VPTTVTYPGVYIEEIPSGVHPIVGVATSIAAFVDGFPRGPLDSAVEVLGFADFERVFGGLDTSSEASYAIQQFFLNGGTDAWVVRTGDATVLKAATALLTAKPGGAGDKITNVTAGRRVRDAAVQDPGTWGNFVRVEVDYDVALAPGSTQSFDELFNLTISEISQAPGRLSTLRSETYRNLTMREGVTNNALWVVNEGSKIVQLDRDGLPAIASPLPVTFRPAATGTIGGPIAATTGAPATGKKVKVNGTDATIDYTGSLDLTGYVAVLEAAIQAVDPTDPLLSGASVRLIPADSVGTNVRFQVIGGRGGDTFDPTDQITFANSGSDTTADTLGLTSTKGAVVNDQQLKLGSGADATAAPSSAVLRGSRAAKTGLYALEDVDLFNILCVPAAPSDTIDDANFDAIVSEYEAYCDERRAFLLVDIPASVNSPPDMQAWLTKHATLRDRNAAVYFPRTLNSDPLNGGRLRNSPASGTLAGLYARTDGERGVWKAPAGTEAALRNVSALPYVLTNRENGTLNPLGANSLRTFPVFGNIAWGARTLAGADALASEWKYVSVRRTALFLEESLYRGTQWVVFEPNDEPLWAQIRLNVGAFMHNLFRQGAFQGASPRDAYLVKCDSETTTQDDINLGIVNILVGFAPLKPAEFVIVKIQQLAGQTGA
jgi:phage tail sheath protein FI